MNEQKNTFWDCEQPPLCCLREKGYGLIVEDCYELSLQNACLSLPWRLGWDLLLIQDSEVRVELFKRPQRDMGRPQRTELILQKGQALWIPGNYSYHLQCEMNAEELTFHSDAHILRLALRIVEQDRAGFYSWQELEKVSPAWKSWITKREPIWISDTKAALEPLLKMMMDMHANWETPAARISGLPSWMELFFLTLAPLTLEKENLRIHPAARATRGYIQDHFTEELSISELAEKVCLHPAYLQRIFRQSYGLTIIQLTLGLRKEYASRLLRDTELSIEEIAQRAGFRSRQFLNAVFAEYFNQSPSSYRREIRKNMLK